jgi:hypothetical protein
LGTNPGWPALVTGDGPEYTPWERETHLSVPVARDGDGRLRLAGYPGLIGAPEVASSAVPAARRAVADVALAAVARRVLSTISRATSRTSPTLPPVRASRCPRSR